MTKSWGFSNLVFSKGLRENCWTCASSRGRKRFLAGKGWGSLSSIVVLHKFEVEHIAIRWQLILSQRVRSAICKRHAGETLIQIWVTVGCENAGELLELSSVCRWSRSQRSSAHEPRSACGLVHCRGRHCQCPNTTAAAMAALPDGSILVVHHSVMLARALFPQSFLSPDVQTARLNIHMPPIMSQRSGFEVHYAANCLQRFNLLGR